MKKLSFLLLFIILFKVNASAQNIPRGMKYQAVARDLKGEVLANAKIELRINLLSKTDATHSSHYSEIHSVVTNQLGLFTLVVGEGKMESGDFEKVPWSSADIWMEIQIKANGQSNFTSISNSQLLAVPYAYYAATAGVLAGTIMQGSTAAKGFVNPRCPCEGGLSQIKVLYRGETGDSIRVYRNKNLTELLIAFKKIDVYDGAILTINAVNFPDGKLKNDTYFQVLSGTTGLSLSVYEIPTECEEDKEPWEFSLGETFGRFSVMSHRDRKNGAECTVCDIRKEWQVGGNGLMDLCNMLGTKSYTDLIFITNNLERLRITKDGDIKMDADLEIGNDLTVNNNLTVINKVDIGDDLTVRKNVFLNTISGSTTNNGPLTVEKETNLKNKLDVTGATHLKNTLTTDEASELKKTLDVTGATRLKNTLIVDGITTINDKLNVTKDVADGQFLATFTNTNNGNGDGIKIELGKKRSIYTVPLIPNLLTSPQVARMKDLIRCDLPGSRLGVLGNIVVDDIGEIGLVLGGLAVGVGNLIIDQINLLLHLPFSIGPYGTPNLHIWDKLVITPAIGAIPELAVPALDIPAMAVLPKVTVMPALPNMDLTELGIPAINPLDLGFWGIPSAGICLNDDGQSPMNNQNEFMRFTDKENVKMGSIRAVSLTDWSANYLDPLFLFKLYGAITSSKTDKFHAKYHFKGELATALKDYIKMGVEYASGNGDYAEWLERKDTKENINAGDIVAVIGGKVTKNLEFAEQVMVVSHNPIVLGNIPAEGKNYQGNNIAFMGQVPVKVVGPIATGDYIVGQSKTPGYGIAKHPNEMTIEDFKFAVGRSWENNTEEGPKMVNTVVGVHNGDYLKILKKFENKFTDAESRLKSLEGKVDDLLKTKPSTTVKKAF